MKKAIVAAVVLIGIAAGTLIALPPVLESRYNRTLLPPPYQFAPQARSLHATLNIVDLHSDTLLWGRDLLSRSNIGHVDVPRLIQANVAVQLFTVVTKVPRKLNLARNSDRTDMITGLAIAQHWPPATWNSLLERALYQADRLKGTAADSRGRVIFVRTAEDLDRFLQSRPRDRAKVAVVLGLEGAHALESDLANLDTLYGAGFRVIGATHFFDTDLAGSATGTRQGGLSAKGREFVHRAEALHILIDLAHASPAAIADVTSIATAPVIVSHTGVQGTCDNPRNLSDENLRAIAKTGGLVGIGYWHTAVCGSDAAAVARAVRYAVNVAGIEHVGLGSDFDGAVTQPFDVTGLPKITEALLNAGFSDAEIRKIMGENALRVIRQVLPNDPVPASYPQHEPGTR